MSNKQHWEQTYTARAPDDLGWFTPHLRQSLAWIEASGRAPPAPPQCANLVHRYDIEALTALLGAGFALQQHTKELHHTPRGKEQMYLYAPFRRAA